MGTYTNPVIMGETLEELVAALSGAASLRPHIAGILSAYGQRQGYTFLRLAMPSEPNPPGEADVRMFCKADGRWAIALQRRRMSVAGIAAMDGYAKLHAAGISVVAADMFDLVWNQI